MRQASITCIITFDLFRIAILFAIDLKCRIAIRAAKMVQPGDSIILDSGSTTLNVAREPAKQDGIMVLTNNLPAAWALSSNREITLVICGGTFRHKTRSFHGSHTESELMVNQYSH
ncbi:hypothetical protein V2A84_05380 [Yersinia sp. 2553 StPb PI]|uniref:hypothetical protein n=1 Tax=Yersinia sp. 2553 StPb PI TaxID=3117411 RepID=UPI003FA41A7F